MKIGEYEVEWSPYIENQIVPEEGQTKEQALEEVLGYHLEKVLEQREPEVAASFSIGKFFGKPAQEVGVFIDPDGKYAFFGTEAEAQTRDDEFQP